MSPFLKGQQESLGIVFFFFGGGEDSTYRLLHLFFFWRKGWVGGDLSSAHLGP